MFITEFLALIYDALAFAHATRKGGLALALQFFIPLAIIGHLVDAYVMSQGKLTYADTFVLTLTGVPVAASLTWGGITYTLFHLSKQFLKAIKLNPLAEKAWLAPLLSAVSAVTLDFIIEVMASSFGLWHWSNEPSVYGIPMRNFIGWFLIIFLYTLTFQELTERRGSNIKSFLLMIALSLIISTVVLTTLILIKPILTGAF